MFGHRRKLGHLVVLLLFLMAGLTPIPSYAQQREWLSKADAPLMVDGVVRQVFRSTVQGREEYLLQIDVQQSEGRKLAPEGSRVRFPGPGDSVYVHVSPRQDQAGRELIRGDRKDIPDEKSQVRAYLTPREQGGWEGVVPGWYEVVGNGAAGAGPDNQERDIARGSRSGESRLGMTTEALKVENRIALRVTSVERSGAAQKCGLEVGDIIAGAEESPITDAAQLEALAAKGKKFSLIVVDVNTGRGARVEIDPTEQPATDDAAGAQATQPPKASLGISAEPVSLGTRSAMRVTHVDPAGLAAKAGLEQGDIVVAANGAPITGPEQLLGALRKSGQTLKLTVRDSRTGRDTEVDVKLGDTKPVNPLPANVESPSFGSPGKLGAVTELAFHDDDFAVKVTEIETGSPAAQAGLRPGVMILAANGKPVLHPNELNDAVRKCAGILKLSVLDPTSGKKRDIDVNIGR
ncbi:Periplasmic serine endoprotease DegP precursor [Lacipirellula limnantheis]|uniref:Periplasmic serine endoprotease DegP n=2 Tax=Lacipirellula limnantheis TaxID=2528024 RepID=A0A517U4Y0_9BACT|nr:Periplasmic serine endoprotease DegP precursor [Lacipirellula limnantheis]